MEPFEIIVGSIGSAIIDDLQVFSQTEAKDYCEKMVGQLLTNSDMQPSIRARILSVAIIPQESGPDLLIATCQPIPDERILDDQEAFRFMVAQGKQLMDLHVTYEDAPEYPLTWIWTEPRTWRVQKMRFSPDKTAIIFNESLTLAGIPPEAHQYVLGNRSALEWILDQYQVTTDARSGIVSDPNRADDPEYIARIVCRVVYVSVETVRITDELARRVNFDDFDLRGGFDLPKTSEYWSK